MSKTLFRPSFHHFQSMMKNKFKIRITRLDQINNNNNYKFNKTILIRSKHKISSFKITNFHKTKSNPLSINNPFSLIRTLFLLNSMHNNLYINNKFLNKCHRHLIITKWINSLCQVTTCKLHNKISKLCNNSLSLFSNQFKTNSLICSKLIIQFK